MQRFTTLRWRQAYRLAAWLFSGIIACTGNLAGQFQFGYGSPDDPDVGQSVAYVTDAPSGWITVGQSFNGANGNVLATRSDINGVLIWSYTYDLQGNDIANDVIVSADGSFVITGSTDAAVPGANDIFLLRISDMGIPLDVGVYGTAGQGGAGNALIEATLGDPGDIVVAGWIGEEPNRNTYLLRTTAGLDPIWNTFLNGAGAGDFDDYFYDVRESIIGPGAGDLIAVGGSSSWSVGGNTDIFITRNNGATGFPGPVVVVGGPGDDEAHSVVELTANVATAGQLAIAGFSESGPNFLFNPNLDACVIQTDANLGVLIGNLIFGEPGEDDELFAVREDLVGGAVPPGLIVAGYTNTEGVNRQEENMVVQRITNGAADLVGFGEIYGGNGGDFAFSMELVPQGAVGDPPGYALVGSTASPELIGPDPQQAYLVRTDDDLLSGCNEQQVLFRGLNLPWVLSTPLGPIRTMAQIPQLAAVTWEENDFADDLCVVAGGAQREDGGVAGLPALGQMYNTLGAESFPNPLRSGEQLNFGFELAEASPAVITVTGISGNVVARYEKRYEAGSVMVAIPTTEWAPGAYVVQLAIGEERVQSKVVVAGR